MESPRAAGSCGCYVTAIELRIATEIRVVAREQSRGTTHEKAVNFSGPTQRSYGTKRLMPHLDDDRRSVKKHLVDGEATRAWVGPVAVSVGKCCPLLCVAHPTWLSSETGRPQRFQTHVQSLPLLRRDVACERWRIVEGTQLSSAAEVCAEHALQSSRHI